jgi:four helix bundle protein
MAYDLEQRTLDFNKNVIIFCKTLKQDTISRPIISQVVRSSGSIGANYIEANESLGKNDFRHHLQIARKEAKETIYWLDSLRVLTNSEEINGLVGECTQLKKILSAIIEKCK